MILSVALLLAGSPLLTVGKFDGRADDLAFGPGGYSAYRADPMYVAGFGEARRDWPYVIPGPGDAWAGGRPHAFSLVFGANRSGPVRLRAAFVGIHPSNPPTLELRANGKAVTRWNAPAGKGDGPVLGRPEEGQPVEWAFDIPADSIRPGENTLEIASISGSWAVFDAVELTSDEVQAAALKPRLGIQVEPPGQVELNGPSGPERAMRLRLLNVGSPTEASLTVDGKTETVNLGSGATELTRNVCSASQVRDVEFGLTSKDGREGRARESLRPVRPWQVLVLPGSHVDVGYTHPQEAVAEIQAQNIRDALNLIEATRNRPAAERYRWNSETAWAAERFLATATPEERRRFERAAKSGEIAVSASYLNLLYGLARPEETIRALTISRETPGLANVPHDTAMLADVPGIPWGLATAMRESGVRQLVLWPNGGDTMRSTLENRPFWWKPRDAQGQVFVWPMFPYSIGTDLKGVFHLGGTWHPGRPKAIRTADPTQHFLDDWLPRELDALERRGYPYRMVGVPWSMGDNGAVDLDLPDAIAAWNKKFANPKLEIADVREACRRFLAAYGKSLPIRAEEFNPQWEDGAASSARETSLNRNASERLVQAEIAWTLSGKPFPKARFAQAWRDVLLYSEHTWGADESIRLPDSENSRRQWATKSGFAEAADRESRALLAEALGNPPAASDAFAVTNLRGQAATERVVLPGRQGVRDAAGKPAPAQALSDGRTAFVATSVPGLASRRYGRGAPLSYVRPKPSATIDNGIYRLTVDPATGRVRSLKSLRLGRELVDPKTSPGFAAFGTITGNDPNALRSLREVRVETLDAGPIVWTLRVSGLADGVRGRVTIDYRLTRGIDGLEVTVGLDKAPVREKEIAFLSFPFAIPGADLHIEEAWAPYDVARERFSAANDQFFSVDRWLHLGNRDFGVTVVSLDTPIVVSGQPSVARLGRPQAFDPHPAAVHFQIAQNHWHVNYRAEQSGPIVARYVVRAGGPYDPAASERLGETWTRPLVVGAFGKHVNAPLRVEGTAQLTAIKREADTMVVRLYNPSSIATNVKVTYANQSRTALMGPYAVRTFRFPFR